MTPYEALRPATVNPAIYLDGPQEFGRVVTGLRADLVLLASNPLDHIGNISSRVGVMKRGRWFPAEELEAALAQIADERN
jgi:imidazolonepropionase-like amidohydrolase